MFRAIADCSSTHRRETRHHRSGSIAIVTAVSMTPLVCAIGLGADYAPIAMVKIDLQKSVDAAALDAARHLENVAGENFAKLEQLDEEAISDGRSYFFANFSFGASNDVTIDSGPTVEIEKTQRLSLEARASARVELAFGTVIGLSDATVAATSSVQRFTRGMEVVLALDTSRSMTKGGRIEALRNGASRWVFSDGMFFFCSNIE
jgi:Flp pilus assembly protein TadG